VRAMAVDLPIPGTRHVGEVFVSLDTDGDGVADFAEQRVAQPHLWSATLTYLSAMALSNPELFAPAEVQTLDLTCGAGEEPRDLKQEAPGCSGCGSAVAGPSGSVEARPATPAAWLLAIGVVSALRLRRRSR